MKARKSSDDRKAEILTATLDLAFEVGPDHVTTGKIAGRLGLTQPAIYKHFPKKEDIWQAITETLCARISENTAQGNLPDTPPLEALRGMVLRHLHLVTEFPALPEIMVTRDPTGRLTDTRRRIQAAMSSLRNALALCLEKLRTAGKLRPDLRTEDGVTLLVGIIQSLVLRLIVTRDPTPLVQEGTRLLDLQLSLFEPEGSQP
ncbi:TetR/AcrR family transcriptional regulator [Aliiroseovarius sp. S1339]|uniref:TetR/AcrR family transcriptional regulator n=1 Tax=Aliiroseovarius sp. S1339 TaxID=2936990 RepID=UPI0020BDBFA8|nr:TetR/AcrR family transcriptional regulator [Aliiroseovarius sp. S1339]MCK8463431.1 TetR/AcrR family transcriptional regulator [Aliiroseovarius sp. S1339]